MKINKIRVRFLFLSFLIFSLFITGCNQESINAVFDNYEAAGGKVEKLKSIAILDFTGKNQSTQDEITGMITDHMRQFGYMKVIDPEESLRILTDKGLPTKGIVSVEDARLIAEALGVDALVYGKADTYFNSCIDYYNTYQYPDNYYNRGRYSYYRRLVSVPYLSRRGYVKMQVHFFDAKIGKEMGKIDLNRNYNRSFDKYYGNPLGKGFCYFFDPSMSIPMPNDHEMILLISKNLVDKLMQSFTPYYISRVRSLCDSIPGADLARQGKWDEARRAWDSIPHGSPDEWKVFVNLGIYFERKGNAARALGYYKEAMNLVIENPDLKEYILQAQAAKIAKDAFMPLSVTPDQIRFRIADVKDDGRIYINAGVENCASPGDIYTIARTELEFQDDFITPKKSCYYKLGEIQIEKVFEGVSEGKLINLTPGKKIHFGDSVILKSKFIPEQPAPAENPQTPDNNGQDQKTKSGADAVKKNTPGTGTWKAVIE